MKNFVKLIQQVHEERFSVVMNKIIGRKLPIAFLSVAPIAQAIEVTKNLRAQGMNVANLIVIDNTPPPSQPDFNVVNLKDAAQIYPQPEYVLTIDHLSARVAIKNFPKSKVLSLDRGGTDHIYQTFMAHLPELQEVYESLIDEESKKTFRGYWLGNISNQLGEIVFANTPHYICTGFIPAHGAIVIDGGVCDGGTTVRFLEMGYRVYGFEMDSINYETARQVAEAKNFIVENFGLGSYNHLMTYKHMPNPGASRLDSEGSETAQIVTLDSYVREKNLPSVDFLKLDVEGAELDVLKGATTSIARYKPILALSAYHKWDDFWTLMNFIKSIRPDYEFAMRQFVVSKEDGAYHFHDGMEENFERLGLRPALIGYNECVLFAR